MKHCLNCYRMLPNDADVCHFCGAPQVLKESSSGKQFSRCPRCMSFLYDDKTGCQFCGYRKKRNSKTAGGIVLIVIILLLFAFFLLSRAGILSHFSVGNNLLSMVDSTKDTYIAGITPPVEEDNMIHRPDRENIPEDDPRLVSEAYDQDQALRDILSSIVADILQSGTQTPSSNDQYVVLRSAVEDVMGESNSSNTTSSMNEDDVNKIVEAVLTELNANGLSITSNNDQVSPGASEEKTFSCNNQISQFSPGMKGSILPRGKVNHVRSGPSLNSEEIDTLYSSTTFVVEDEPPVCADGYLWIKIRITHNGKIGWTAEADGNSYWLTPLR